MQKNGESFSMTIPGVVATSLIAHKDGSLWIGAADGLRRFINGKLLKICGDKITSLYVDQQDKLWVGTDTGLKRWTDDGLRDSVISGAISCIYQDRNGNLWVGSYQVLHCLRKGKLTSYRLGTGSNKTLGTEILEDEKGYLWIGTGEGIIRSSLENGQMVSIPFSSAQGLNSPECANGKPAAYKSTDGRFWFATVNGLAEIDPGNYFVNKIAPTVTVEQVTVDRVQVPKFRERNLKFPAGTARIEFQYAGLSSFSHVSYRYVLQGFDQFWTNAGGQTRTIYTNLPPGKYRFKVLACNQDGIWNIKGDSVSFEIESAAFHFSEKLIVFPLAAAVCGFFAGWLLGKFKSGRPA
jgi:ligand-binding sensor domain-containing protein